MFVNRCNFNATYTLHFQSTCQPTSSAFPCGSLAIDVPAVVYSSNFCGDLYPIGNIGLSGSMQSYFDSSHTPPAKTIFMMTETVYFLLTATSAEATIGSTTILSINVQSGLGQQYTLYDYTGSAPALSPFTTSSGSTLGLVVSSGVDTAAFQFQLLQSMFSLGTTLQTSITVTVIAYVQFAGNSGRRLLSTTYTLPAANSRAHPFMSSRRQIPTSAMSAATVGLGYESFAINKQALWKLATRSLSNGPKMLISFDKYIDTYRMLVSPSVAVPMSTTMDSGVVTRTVFGLQSRSSSASQSSMAYPEGEAEPSPSSISPGAQVGIVLGTVFVAVAATIGVVLYIRSRAQRKWMQRMAHMDKAQNHGVEESPSAIRT